MSASERVRLTSEDRDGGRIVTITIDYPERLNVLNTPIIQDLIDTVHRLSADEQIRAIVITGAGDRAFVGGADAFELVELNARTAETFITSFHRFLAALRDCPHPRHRSHRRPLPRRRHGPWAAACDLRAASDRSTFGMPEVRVGIPSVIEAALLPGIIGWGRARELLYTGDTVDGATAAAWGLIERVVPADQLDAAVDGWITSILACGPRAIRAQKTLMHKWESLPLTAAIAVGIPVFAEAFATDEPRTYLKSFLNRPR